MEANFFLGHKSSLLKTLTAAAFSDGGMVPFGQKGESCMQKTRRIKSRQSRFKRVSKVCSARSKVASSVSLHFASKGVCLWTKEQERSLHP